MFKLLRYVFALLALAAPAAATQGAVLPNSGILAQSATMARTDPKFASAGWLAGISPTGTLVAGSAILIEPHWVLTAAHIVDPQFNPGYPSAWTGMKFSLSASIYTDPPNYVFADAWYVSPGFGGGYASASGSDLGLVHLVEPITSVAPAERFRGVDEIGTSIYAVGYGQPGTAGNGIGAYDGVKRAGTNSIHQSAQYPLGTTNYIFTNSTTRVFLMLLPWSFKGRLETAAAPGSMTWDSL